MGSGLRSSAGTPPKRRWAAVANGRGVRSAVGLILNGFHLSHTYSRTDSRWRCGHAAPKTASAAPNAVDAQALGRLLSPSHRWQGHRLR